MNMQTLSWLRLKQVPAGRANIRCASCGLFSRYSLVLFLFLGVMTVLTWGRWTVVAFPLDAGREMIVPQMLLEGRALYTDIRCFYGPLGYWLNAGLTALLGDYENGFWLVNLLRFAGMLVLLWLLAWKLLSPPVALLAMTSGVFTLFYSFAVPYTAAIGWGAVFLVGGILCAARPLSIQASLRRTGRAVLNDANSRSDFNLTVWSVSSAVLLALAAVTKHEYTAAAGVVWVILLLDLLLRHEHASRRCISFIGAFLGFLLPIGLLALFLVATVSWPVLIRENLWLENLLQYHTTTGDYTLWSICTPFNLLNMLSWIGLLAAVISGASLVLGMRMLRKGRGSLIRPSTWRLVAAIWIGLAVTLLIEIYLHSSGLMPRHGLIGFRQFRPREWIEALPVLCLPLSGLFVIYLLRSVWKGGPRRAWQKLGTRGRLLAVCVAVYLVFAGREVPGGIALVRQPLGTILLAALLSVYLPRLLHSRATLRRMTRFTTAFLLLGLTLCAVDAIAYLQSRPSGTLRGRNGLMHVYQRRQPFTPQWFQAGLNVIDAHETQLAGRTIACVPEGAWINALAGLPWPMRDTQWMPFCQKWLVEDLTNTPPDFLLVMEPETLHDLTKVEPIISEFYIPIDTNSTGMTLYQIRPEYRNREPFSEHRESIP
ncbi:MAG: hypothetical protein GXY44_14140 [Phycisphaerales bacterium]|nr:hypothetical protein [Phycisphaerales bacterium]